MIGVIVVGHGTFADGMYEAVRLIAGKPEYFCTVDYLQEDSIDDFELKLKEKIAYLSECSGILIMSDLIMAAPYKTAVALKKKYALQYHIEVVTGTNLGMLVQVNLARGYVNNLKDLTELAIEEGKKQIVWFDGDNEE